MNSPFPLLCAVSLLLIPPLSMAADDADPAAEKKIIVAVTGFLFIRSSVEPNMLVRTRG